MSGPKLARGVPRMTEKKLEAARLAREGLKRREIAWRMNVSAAAVTRMLEDVDAYEADMRRLLGRRTG